MQLSNDKLLEKYKPKIDEFASSIQKGDIKLLNNINYGFALYGFTKIGKTALSHLLAGSPLIGIRYAGQIMVEPTSRQFKSALIGNQGHSQTQIPNIFETNIEMNNKNEKVVIIDKPGYADSYGVLRILSNGYFHYRVFSKCKKMKFLLCLDKKQLKTSQKLISTIKQFTKSFRDYQKNPQQIWASSAIVITKCQGQDPSLYTDQAIQKLNKLINDYKGTQTNFIHFVKSMIENKKIFTVNKFREHEKLEYHNLLCDINSRITHWWKRTQIKEGVIDMRPIRLALGESINHSINGIQNTESRNHFKALILYFNNKINQYIKGSFKSVIDKIAEDSMGKPDSCQFLTLMKQFVRQNYFKLQMVDQKVRKQRQQIEKELFELPSLKMKNSYGKPYFLKKFDVLLKIQQGRFAINNQSFRVRDNVWLEQCSEKLYSMIRQLNTIRYDKVNSHSVIYKYGYLLKRLIEEQKLFTLLIQGQPNTDTALQTQQTVIKNQIFDKIKLTHLQIPRILKDFMGLSFTYKEEQHPYIYLKQLYVKNAEIAKLPDYTLQTVEFFASKEVNDQEIAEKIIRVVIQHSKTKTQSDLTLISKLCKCRINCEYLIEMEMNQNKKQSKIILLRQVTCQLGRLLTLAKYYKQARKVYKTIRFVSKVCEIYKQQIRKQPLNIQLRLQFARYSADHFRQNEAIQNLQQAFQLPQSYRSIGKVTKLMFEIRQEQKQRNQEDYTAQLFNNRFYEHIDSELEKKLTSMGTRQLGRQIQSIQP